MEKENIKSSLNTIHEQNSEFFWKEYWIQKYFVFFMFLTLADVTNLYNIEYFFLNIVKQFANISHLHYIISDRKYQ